MCRVSAADRVVCEFVNLITRAEEASGSKRVGMNRTITVSHDRAMHAAHRDTNTVASHSSQWNAGLIDYDEDEDEWLGKAGMVDRIL